MLRNKIFLLLIFIISSVQGGSITSGDTKDANVGFERWSGSPIIYDFDYSGNFFVGRRYNNEVMSYIIPFKLPYLPEGHQVTSAKIEFYLEEKVGNSSMDNMNVVLYGLNRTDNTVQVYTSDHYSGINDPNNTLLNESFINSQTSIGKLEYSGSNLTNFLNQRYNSVSSSENLFIYFRLSPSFAPPGETRYIFTSMDYYKPDFRNKVPVLKITSNGPTPIKKIDKLQFSFYIEGTKTTSAGIFSEEGKLIKTLWNNRIFDSTGTNYETWDGKDDKGSLVSLENNSIKILQHNVEYFWDGIVGNTSLNNEGYIHRSFFPISSMSIVGNKAYFATSYNERQVAMRSFNLDNPQQPYDILPDDPFSVIRYVATDGVKTYWVKVGEGFSGTGTKYSGIFATNNSDNSFYIFPNGTSLSTSTQRYPSIIDYSENLSNAPLGIAVQKDGPFLIISSGQNLLKIYDKISGSLVSQLSIDNPRGLTIGSNGILWVICKNNNLPCIKNYKINPDGSLQEIKKIINNIVQPVAIDIAPDNSYIIVADSSSSQQLKAFSNSTEQLLWSYGQLGGNRSLGPEIINDRFEFTDDTFIAFQPDGSFWIGDQGNLRYLLFSSQRDILNQIFYLKHHYIATSDPNDPSKVFAEFFEFKIDYSKSLKGNNGSWKLIKNWRYGLPENNQHLYTNGLLAGIISSITLQNKTYALLENLRNGRFSLFELPSSGPARWTGQEFEPNTRIYNDGSMRWSTIENNQIKFYQASLSNIDKNGNPHWTSPELIASAPAEPSDPINLDSQWNRQTIGFTSDNIITSFNNSKFHTGYHLGGIRLGSNEWFWRASPSTSPSYSGPFPDDGRFDIGNGIQYAGNIQVSFGQNVIYGYHGEFWKNTQASQWVHFYDNGLMIGRFGTEGTSVPIDKAVAGFAGNAFSPSVVTYNNKTYLYINDESNHGGIHRWNIYRLDSILEFKKENVSINQVINISNQNKNNNLNISLISPAPNTKYSDNTKIYLTASTSISNKIIKVEFFDGSNKIGEDYEYPYSIEWIPNEQGIKILTAKLNISDNTNIIVSQPVTIIVGNTKKPKAPNLLTENENYIDNKNIYNKEIINEAIGRIISIAFRQGINSQYNFSEMEHSGIYPFTRKFFNNYDAWDKTYTNPLDSNGSVVSNLKIALNARGQGQGWSLNKWTGLSSGHKLFVESMVSMTNGVRVDFVPFSYYDLIVYSLPNNIQFGPQSSFVRIITGPYINTVTQNFNIEPTNYSVKNIPLGNNITVQNKNTLIFKGLTSHWFNLNGPNLCGFQIVERSEIK